MAKVEDLIGLKFSRLTVISVDHRDKKNSFLKCRCDCGDETIVVSQSLRSGGTKSCGCLRKEHGWTKTWTKIQIGEKYHRLTPTERLPNDPRGWSLFKCQCECGAVLVVPGYNLHKTRQTHVVRSCGCALRDHLKRVHIKIRRAFGRSAAHAVYLNNKAGALKRGIEWNLSEETFLKLNQMPCAYCGDLLTNTDSGVRRHGGYTYNGVDRVNNDKGYIEGNVVSSCYVCNLFKGTLTVDQFKQWIKDIWKHHAAA